MSISMTLDAQAALVDSANRVEPKKAVRFRVRREFRMGVMVSQGKVMDIHTVSASPEI
ncbi:MAG: hypothetical protein RIA65_11025 [Woeseia sp.]